VKGRGRAVQKNLKKDLLLAALTMSKWEKVPE